MEVRNPASTSPVSAAQANRVACRPCQLRLANHPPPRGVGRIPRNTRGRGGCPVKSTGTAAPSGRESLLCWQVGATMVPMIRTPCPTCGTPVMATHRCPGRTIDPPTPRPPEFWDWVAEARAELEAESRRRAVVQEALPLDDVDGVSSGP